jgi:hypothetical protein
MVDLEACHAAGCSALTDGDDDLFKPRHNLVHDLVNTFVVLLDLYF